MSYNSMRLTAIWSAVIGGLFLFEGTRTMLSKIINYQFFNSELLSLGNIVAVLLIVSAYWMFKKYI